MSVCQVVHSAESLPAGWVGFFGSLVDGNATVVAAVVVAVPVAVSPVPAAVVASAPPGVVVAARVLVSPVAAGSVVVGSVRTATCPSRSPWLAAVVASLAVAPAVSTLGAVDNVALS